MKLTPFRDLLDRYDIILFDSYGVLKNYKGVIDGVQDTLSYIHQLEKKYRIITNDASSSQQRLSERFMEGGLKIKPHRIVTSGMMARNFLTTKTIDGKVLFLGTESSSEYIVQAHKDKIHIHDFDEEMTDEIGCVVFLDDEGYDWNTDINKVVNLLRKKSVPTIVANSDMIYPVSKNDVAIATGAVAQLVESVLGYKFIHFGKPDIQMFAHAYDDLLTTLPNLQKQQILMVGDTLHTDILGGVKFGIDTALVLSGNTSASYVDVAIQSTGIAPDYVCESIVF